jgi:glycosyltransferase involved in cell wall biosynthesis
MQISKHHYALELAKRNNQVYFISPPSRSGKFLNKREVAPNVYVIEYRAIFRGQSYLPTNFYQFLKRMQTKLLRMYISKKPDVIWSFDSNLFKNLKWFGADLNIFHPVDELGSNTFLDIAKTSHIVFTCSNRIVNQMIEVDRPKFVINHGVTPSFINYSFPIETRSEPVSIGYIGNLFIENLDRALLRNLVSNYPQHHFHFYGASKPKNSNIAAWVTKESTAFVEFLLQAKNVTCHGAILPEDLPENIKDHDAFLVCYYSSEGNRISNSHKILEYFCTGKVVISTHVEHYRNSSLLAMCEGTSHDEFFSLYQNVTANLQEYNSTSKQGERREFAHQSSYSANVDRIELLVNENIK